MSTDAWLTVATVVLIFMALVANLAPVDLLFLAGAAFLAACGVISPAEAFAGFSNPGVLTVAVLFVVAAGLRETGVLDYVGHRVLGRADGIAGATRRLAAVVLPSSAFLNNTPIVAMFVPIVLDWCRRHRVSPSKLLIPLSFLAILGGTCTLIGTSTNLVVNGLMLEENQPGMELFEIGKIGLPYAAIGFAYLYLFGSRLLPDRKEFLEQLTETRREYLAEMKVRPGCRLVGQTVEEAGLRHLTGLFLIEINRGDAILSPVGPEDRIEAEDALIFTGVLSDIIEIERIPGLIPAADPSYEVAPSKQRGRRLCEVVISPSSSLIGKSVRAADFRAAFGAAVVAVHRGGARVKQKVGDIELRPGDTLLLQVGPHFLRAYRNDPSFYLISAVDDWRPLRRDRAWSALALFLFLVVVMTLDWLPVVVVATLAAVLMVALGCISPGDARRSIDYQVIVTIAAAFAIGAALEKSGAISVIAERLFAATHGVAGLAEQHLPGMHDWGPLASLAIIYLVVSLLTSLITNNAAAVLMFPLCLKTAELYHASPTPFFVVLMLAASASFMTPIGYQTNMLVYGAGGYRFGDFLKIGIPLNLLLWIVAVVLVPWFWPF
ncbi:MAG: SLC13 family permease [Pirellulales bacterium]|nr:SLC13 family permease [Pirellulales bacterium]